jgi:hypothetical protein
MLFTINPHSASWRGHQGIQIEAQPKPEHKEEIVTSAIDVENLDQLGIVAGLIDEIGRVEIRNNRLGIDSSEKVSTGVIVKATLLNGLGFRSAPLNLCGQFCQGKATEQLWGEVVQPEHLNDDRLGHVLEEVDGAGLNQLFLEFALAAANKFEINRRRNSIDNPKYQTTATLASGDSDRLCYFDRSEVVATAIDRS